MYLTKIELTNFQSHKSTTINLASGFICIAGRTRSGKSSVLRALNFLFNDIWSDSFIRTGEKSVKVTVTLDTGTVVSREKGNGLNKITVISPDETSKEFNNFGIQAPIEVKNILGVFPLVIDNDYSENINIHMQDDPHFLITKSAPMKTKFINRLTRLHIIDSVNRSITNDLQDNNKELEKLDKDILALKQIISKYDSLQSKKSFYQDLQNNLNAVTKLVENINLKYDKLFILATKSAEYLRMKALYERRKNIIRKISGVQGLLKNYTRISNLLLLYAKQRHLNNLINKQNELLSFYNEVKKDFETLNLLNNMEQKLITLNEKKKLDEEQTTFIAVAKEHTKVCPTCKRPLWEREQENSLL